MKKQIPLYLKPEERAHLEQLIRSGSAPARTQTRARILLLIDRSTGDARTESQVAQSVLCSVTTVGNVRARCLKEGIEAALYDKPRPGRAPKITGDIEAQITVLACSDPPEGRAKWTVRLLSERVVELGLVDSLHHTTLWERLKKTNSSPGKSKPGSSVNPLRST
jgi:putative transposase